MNGRGSTLQSLGFLVLSLLAIYVHLAPMQLTTDSVVLPDLLFALAFAWTMRRPESMPLLLTAGVFLLADLLLDRPVGLWALLCLLALESGGGRRETLRNQPFLAEWVAFALALAAVLILRAVVLLLALVDSAPGGVALQFFAVTVLCYPLVVLMLHYLFRIRSPKPAERSRRLGRVA